MSKVELVRTYPYKIRTYQVGSTGRISLHHVFNLLQDVAHRDALRFGFGFPQLLKMQRFWVLSRMSLALDHLPSYDDNVEIQTWVKSVKSPRSEREFAILFAGQTVIRATSLWYCLSTENHRPANIPMEENLVDLINDNYALEGGAQKVENFSNSGWDNEVVQRARYSDVDMMKHVNNASYVRWVMDEARNIFPNQLVKQFSINYLNEVHLGENIKVRHKAVSNQELIHEIIHADTGRAVCKTRTAWH